MILNVAINGFGRIGRCLLRNYFANIDRYGKFMRFVAINADLDAKRVAHYLKYDSIYGKFTHEIEVGDNFLEILGQKIELYEERNIEKINWRGIDLVAECTGKFNKGELAKKHETRHVLVSAPVSDADRTIIYGINQGDLRGDEQIISTASCTSNCLLPLLYHLHQEFGVESGFMTTIHSYTNDQRILDGSHKDLRRARACVVSMIPTSTGATKSVGKIIPGLDGKIQGQSLRIPTASVSAIDLSCVLQKRVDLQIVNDFLEDLAQDELRNILEICKEALVSSDFVGNEHSTIVDFESTHIVGNLARFLCWYDNEWGFVTRMLDIMRHLASLH